MNKHIIELHAAVSYFEAMGAWGMAQVYRKWLCEELERFGGKK